jgi:hypothetical protein
MRESAGGDGMQRLTNRRLRVGLCLGTLALLALGCASARVENVQANQTGALPRPGRVIVFDFDTGGSDVNVGSTPLSKAQNAVGLGVRDQDVLAAAVADAFAARIVSDVSGLGLTAVRAPEAAAPEVNDLVIWGQFLKIDKGSMTQRFVIGLGFGATELRTQVQMFQVTALGWRPVKQFDTVAQGARFPGAAFFVAGGAAMGTVATSAMITSGVGVVRELRSSIDADAGRTSAQITSKVQELRTENRW